ITATNPRPRLMMVPTVSGAFRPASRAGSAACSAKAGTLTRTGRIQRSIKPTLLLQPLDAFTRADHIGQPDTEFFVNHHHFPVCNQSAVDQDIQRLTRQPVQLDDRALVQLQQVTNRYLGVAHLHGNGDRDIQDHVDIGCLTATGETGVLGKLFHRCRSHILSRGPGAIAVVAFCFSHGGSPLVFPGPFGVARLIHGGLPLSGKLFVFTEFFFVFLVVVSHCVPPSVVSSPWAMQPFHEFSAPACRRGFPWSPCRSEYRWLSPSDVPESLPESHHRL